MATAAERTGEAAAGGAEKPEFSQAYLRYALGILFVVYVVNFIDRQILSILLEPIKHDLGLSDTQLGFLTGFAFAVFYATLGMPIARIADRVNRVSVISVCMGLWSLATAASGFAQGFVQLLLARIGVGIGEAGCSPPAHSLIADYFPPQKRATALGIYAMGINFGILLGFLIGGWVNEWFGWRTAFLVVGVPGVLLALVVKLTLREPPRGMSEGGVALAEQPPVKDVFKYLWKRRSFRHMAFASSMQAFVGYGILAWVPAFFIRSHDMGTGEVGTWLSMILGFAGAAGTFAGGILADRLSSRTRRWYMWVPGISMFVATPFSIGVYLWPEPVGAMLWFIIPVLLSTTYTGPTFAMTQSLSPHRMRALASAVLLFIINIIGLGLGPQVIGILSDSFRAYLDLGEDSLRYAILAVSMAYLIAAWHYYLASRTLEEDLDAVGK